MNEHNVSNVFRVYYQCLNLRTMVEEEEEEHHWRNYLQWQPRFLLQFYIVRRVVSAWNIPFGTAKVLYWAFLFSHSFLFSCAINIWKILSKLKVLVSYGICIVLSTFPPKITPLYEIMNVGTKSAKNVDGLFQCCHANTNHFIF